MGKKILSARLPGMHRLRRSVIAKSKPIYQPDGGELPGVYRSDVASLVQHVKTPQRWARIVIC